MNNTVASSAGNRPPRHLLNEIRPVFSQTDRRMPGVLAMFLITQSEYANFVNESEQEWIESGRMLSQSRGYSTEFGRKARALRGSLACDIMMFT
jgi:hypothetical protein